MKLQSVVAGPWSRLCYLILVIASCNMLQMPQGFTACHEPFGASDRPISTASPWKQHTIDNSSRGADGVRLMNINPLQDSYLDIATGWEEGGVIRVYTNPGPEHVRNRWPLQTVGHVKSPEDAVFADLDNDGHYDVISCCEGKTRQVYIHWAPSSGDQWTSTPIPAVANKAMWMFCKPMDVDGRNGIDLVCAAKGPDAEIGWLESPAQARDTKSWRWHPLAPVGWVMSIELQDMDQDGDLDIIYTDRKGSTRGLHWLEFNIHSHMEKWQRHTIGGTDREMMFMSQGDLNGDNITDIAVAVRNGPITVFTRDDAKSTNWKTLEFPLPSAAGNGKGVAIADMNHDGFADLVFSCEHSEAKHGLGWLQSPGTLVNQAAWDFHTISGADKGNGIKFDLIVPLDLDADGDLDIITCEERDNLGVIWYENPHQ